MSEKEQPKQVVLKNVRVKWAKLIRPGAAFDEGQPDLWSVNMYVTAEDRDRLLAIGCTAKTDKDDQEFFIAKRNTVNKNGEHVKPPALVNGHKHPFTEEVGNGSVCNIAVTPFAWTKAKKSGVILYLNAVQVINHVPASNGADVFDVVGDAASGSGEFDDLPFA